MPLYEIASTIAVVLGVVLSVIQVIMRQQVHNARFGNQEISPWDVRFSNDLLGQYGIWKLHKRAYERSRIRSLVCRRLGRACLISIIVAIGNFLYVR